VKKSRPFSMLPLCCRYPVAASERQQKGCCRVAAMLPQAATGKSPNFWGITGIVAYVADILLVGIKIREIRKFVYTYTLKTLVRRPIYVREETSATLTTFQRVAT